MLGKISLSNIQLDLVAKFEKSINNHIIKPFIVDNKFSKNY